MRRVLHFSARALRAIIVAAVLILVASAIFLNSNYFDSILKDLIETKGGPAIRREIKVSSVAFNPFKLDVLLKDFTIGNDPRSPETPFFTSEEIYARVSWRNLLRGKLRIREVRLKKPVLNLTFYEKNRGGGNNFPTRAKKEVQQKKRELDIIVSQADIQNMTIVMDQRRVPISFSVKDLQARVNYDLLQNNYLASTSFKSGFLKIMNYEFWKFDMKAEYRIVGNRLVFNKLNLVSTGSKFYLVGDMYASNKPFFDMYIRSNIELTQAKQMFHLGPEMEGRGVFRGQYRGTFEQFNLRGAGNFHNFMFYKLPIDQATFNLELNENRLNVTDIKASMFDGSYNGTFAIAPLKGRSIFKADAKWKNWDGRRLGRFIRMTDMVLPVKASGSANLRWEEGRTNDMTGNVRFQLEPHEALAADLAVEAERSNFNNALFQKPYVLPAYNETEFRLEGRQMRDLKSHLQTPYTNLDVSGTIDFSGEANLDVVSHTTKIAEIDLLFHHLQAYFSGRSANSQEFWAVKGGADFKGKLDATVWNPFRPRLTGEVIGSDILYHGVPWDRVQGDVQFHDKVIEIFDSRLALGKATAQAKATFFLKDSVKGTPNALKLVASVQDFPTAEVAHAFSLDLPVHGTIDATLELKGPFAEVEGRADFESSGGDFWGEKWDRGKGTVLFFPDSLGIRDVTAYLNGGSIQASGDLVYESDEYNVHFSAENIPLQRLTVLKKADLEISGIGSATGGGEGTLRKPELHATVDLKNLIYRGEAYGNVAANVKLQPETIFVNATGVARGITSTVSGKVSLDGNFPMEANLDIQKFPLEILTRTYAPETKQLTGLIGGKFLLKGTLRPAEIRNVSGALDLIQIDVLGVRLQQERPIDVVLSDSVIQIKDSSLVGEHARISIIGKIYPREKGRLDLNVTTNIGLEVLSQWDPDITASGPATAKVEVSGTLKQPTLTGVMDIKDGFFRHYSFPNSLTDITALISFKNRDITLQSFQANSAGGTLTAGGAATLKGYALDTYRFDVYAKEIRVQYPEGLRSTVTGEIHLQAKENSSYLTGDIDILQGIYTRSFEESPSVFGYARVPAIAGLGPKGTEQPPMKLNVLIHSDGNLLVRNNFANITSSANLNLIGTMDNPVLIGRLEVVRGVITFQDRDYNVVRGSLSFSNPYRTEASLNFTAETRIREYRITLNFTGTFDRIYHDLSSDPPLPRDDIYAMLGIGRAPGEYTGVDASTVLIGQEISRFITNPIASPIERGFRKAIGLQKFQIDPTYVQSTQVATARITLQKDISSDFSITYSTNLFTVAEEIVLLQYQLTDEIQITASKDERARYGVDLLVTRSFE